MSKSRLFLSVLVACASAWAVEPREYSVVRSGTVESQQGYLEPTEAVGRDWSEQTPDRGLLTDESVRLCERPVDPPLLSSGRRRLRYSTQGPTVNVRSADEARSGVTAAAGDLVIFRSSSPQAAIATAPVCNAGGGTTFQGGTSFTCEPTVTSDGDVQFMTGNWFAALSDDGGLNWRYIDPFDNFNADGTCDVPANSGRFCCDQVALHDTSRDQLFWYLQYTRDGNGNNAQRLAVARTMSDLLSNTWSFYDFRASDFGFNGAFWLDFPDLTLSDNFLWVTTRIFDNASPAASQGELLMRIPLDDLKAGGGIGFQFTVFPAGSPVRCVRGAGDTAFCAQQNLLDTLRIHRWAEASNQLAFDDVDHPELGNNAFACTGPGNRNFCQLADNRVLGASRQGGVLEFMRMSSQNENFPYPYVDVVKVRESDREYLTTEPIWSNQFAVTYPSIQPNSGGGRGGTLMLGGGTTHPSFDLFIVDSFNNNSFAGLEVVEAAASTATQPLSAPGSANRWGDYLSTRLHWLDDRTYISSGYTLNGPNASNVVPISVWFGREQDQPPGDFDLRSVRVTPESSYRHGESLDVGASVANVGIQPISVPILEFRLSTDTDVNVGDRLFGVTAVNLDGGAFGESHVVAPIPEVASGDYFVGAFPLLFADAFNGNHHAVNSTPIRICPNIAEHPVSIDVPACGTATYHAASTGTEEMNFRWQHGLFDFENLVEDIRTRGASTDTLTLDRVIPSDGQVTYRAVVSNSLCSELGTIPAGLHVIPPTASPIAGGGNHIVCEDTTLDATSNGIPAFTYRWRQNGATLIDDDHRSGSRQEDLAFDGLLYSDNGQYTVRIDNKCAGSDSQAVPLSVAYKPWNTVASTGPAARNSQAMAYDSRRGVTVMFGGLTPDNSTRNRETWEWNGSVWSLRSTIGPSARSGAAMAYDPTRGVCVLFGGSDNHKTYAQDTWEWDGVTWTPRVVANPPLQRIPGGMVYDSSAGKIVMHGGWVGFPSYQYLHDTWEYDGALGAWTQVSDGIPELPPGNYNNFPAFAYDSARNKRYVFNAYVVPGDFYPWDLHTFEWDGTQWVRIFPTNDPQYINPGNYRGGASIAYHEGRQMVIWNNGAYAFTDPVQVTWGFNGTAWTLLSLYDGPPRSASGNIAYDSERNAIVQFGGAGPWGMSPADTWELVDADRVEIVRAPENRAVISGQPVEFSVLAKGAPNLTYQWRRNGHDLNDGAVISGVTSSRLRLNPATFAHPGAYDVIIANDCGSVTSAAANLTVLATRFGDGDVDGDVDLDDASLLPDCQTAPGGFRAVGCEPYDFDGDGDVDLSDVAEFQLAFGG